MSFDSQNKLFETNNYSIISKYSCVKAGYQKDVVLEKFMEDCLQVKSWKRTPLINRGYAARMMSIDWIVNRSIRFDGVDCFIILGAGFDFLPFRQGLDRCSWIELDLHEVISTKANFIQSEKLLAHDDELIQVSDGILSSTSSKYHLIECDLRHSAMLISRLKQVFSKLKAKNIAIINEVCLCYIDLVENRRILSTVIDAVQDFALRVHYIGYEQYKAHEKSPFNDVMYEHFSAMSYPLKHFPSSAQLRQLFLTDLKFNHLTVVPTYQIYHTALEEHKETFKQAYQEQPFDEYEELSLYLSHYALVTGVLILRDPFIESSDKKSTDAKTELAETLNEMTLDGTNGSIDFVPSELERYGHSSCAIEASNGHSYSIFVSGGFGKSPGRINIPHKRLGDCLIIKKQTNDATERESWQLRLVGTENIDPNRIRLDRLHGQVVSFGGNKLFFNGGRQSPNKHDGLNSTFVGHLLDEDTLELRSLSKHSAAKFVRWRHKLCPHNSSHQFLQVGGLSVSENYADPVVLWNLDADKLGATMIPCADLDLFRRHSFAMDARDSATFLVMGGLQTLEPAKGQPVEANQNTVLWDTRLARPQIMHYDCGSSYGSSMHFVNDFQLIKMGGISTKTGLAESTIQMLDLRNEKHTVLGEDVLPLADQRLILTNTSVCHSKGAREIITTGGGGNYFTFGTRFNKTHLVYRYA